MFLSKQKRLATLEAAIVDQHRTDRLEWWKNWQTADYSWDGLARRKIEYRSTHDQRYQLTLQDLFFAEARDLHKAPDGRFYTRFHYPWYVYDNGNLVPTDKHTWPQQTWLELNERLAALFAFPRQPISYERLDKLVPKSKNQITFRSGETDDVSPLAIDLSGTSLADGHAGLVSATNVKLDQICFRNFEVSALHTVPNRNVVFVACLFENDISVESTSILSPLQLQSCIVAGHLIFRGCEFTAFHLQDVKCRSLQFTDSKAERLRVKATFAEPDSCRFHHSNISGDADFRGSGLSFIAAFDTLKIDGQLRVHPDRERSSPDRIFKKEMLTPVLLRTDRQAVGGGWHGETMKVERGRMLRHLENGARALKSRMVEEKNEELAHRYYRFELWARNYNPSTEAGTRWLLSLYRITSRYGHDVIVPLFWVLLLWAVAGFFYMLAYTAEIGWKIDWANPSFASWKYIGDAWSFSVSRIAPIIPWKTGIPIAPGSMEFELKTASGGLGLAVHSVAILQTTISTALFFLAGLAARRRFKMAD